MAGIRASFRSKGRVSSVMRPDSMRDTSRMSVTSRSRVTLELRTSSTISACWGDSGVRARASMTPMTPFSGVRIS